MIYTSNFSKSSKAKGKRVSIVRKRMSWVNTSMYDKWWLELAPGEDLLSMYKSGLVSDDKYREVYLNRLLSNEDAKKRIAELVTSKEDITLLCYCATGKFCHRLLIAEVLNRLGVETEEL